MNRFANKALETIKRYPFSISAFIFTLVPWVFTYGALININYLQPAPKGTNDNRGESLMFVVIIALLLAGILSTVAVVNLIIQKDKSFYAKLSAIIVISNLMLYGIGMML